MLAVAIVRAKPSHASSRFESYCSYWIYVNVALIVRVLEVPVIHGMESYRCDVPLIGGYLQDSHE